MDQAPSDGDREREKRRENFEGAAQRLQDVTNSFGIFSPIRLPLNADTCLSGPAIVRTHIQFNAPATVEAWHYTGTVTPPYPAQLESATNTPPGHGRRRAKNGACGRAPTTPSRSSTQRCESQIQCPRSWNAFRREPHKVTTSHGLGTTMQVALAVTRR